MLQMQIDLKLLEIRTHVLDNKKFSATDDSDNKDSSSVSISDIATASKIPEKNINAEYLNWVSDNQPACDETRGAYYSRMKTEFPDFRGGKVSHNKFMRALGWEELRAGNGNYLWAAKKHT